MSSIVIHVVQVRSTGWADWNTKCTQTLQFLSLHLTGRSLCSTSGCPPVCWSRSSPPCWRSSGKGHTTKRKKQFTSNEMCVGQLASSLPFASFLQSTIKSQTRSSTTQEPSFDKIFRYNWKSFLTPPYLTLEVSLPTCRGSGSCCSSLRRWQQLAVSLVTLLQDLQTEVVDSREADTSITVHSDHLDLGKCLSEPALLERLPWSRHSSQTGPSHEKKLYRNIETGSWPDLSLMPGLHACRRLAPHFCHYIRGHNFHLQGTNSITLALPRTKWFLEYCGLSPLSCTRTGNTAWDLHWTYYLGLTSEPRIHWPCQHLQTESILDRAE